MKRALFVVVPLLLISGQSRADVTILDLQGEVRVRPGLEEQWHPAAAGALLREIDTILTGEGEVELELEDGSRFFLGSHAILDIGDLRRITKHELFLYLMSRKIDRLSPRTPKSRLKVGSVSVVHGERVTSPARDTLDTKSDWRAELNGALALYDHDLYTNAVVKLHNIELRHLSRNDCGAVSYWLGRSFEHLQEPGQALDAYRRVIGEAEECGGTGNEERIRRSAEAIDRLSDQ